MNTRSAPKQFHKEGTVVMPEGPTPKKNPSLRILSLALGTGFLPPYCTACLHYLVPSVEAIQIIARVPW